MKYKEFKKWCSQRANDGCWSLNRIFYWIIIILMLPLILILWLVLALINGFDDKGDDYYEKR